MKKIIIWSLVSIGIIGITTATLTIQTNLENAVQTIKKIFITSDGQAASTNNRLFIVNENDDGKVYVKNTLETDGEVVLNGITDGADPINNYKVLTIDTNNIVYTKNASDFGWSGWWGTWWSTSWIDGSWTVMTFSKVGIKTIGLNNDFWVAWRSLFQDWGNYIYLYPGNSTDPSYPWITNSNNNLKIQNKSGGALYINYDHPSHTYIYSSINTLIAKFMTNGTVWFGLDIADTGTNKVDINADNGYEQLRLRNSYTPTSSSDPNGEVGSIVRDDDYLYIKTNSGWKRALLSTFGGWA